MGMVIDEQQKNFKYIVYKYLSYARILKPELQILMK